MSSEFDWKEKNTAWRINNQNSCLNTQIYTAFAAAFFCTCGLTRSAAMRIACSATGILRTGRGRLYLSNVDDNRHCAHTQPELGHTLWETRLRSFQQSLARGVSLRACEARARSKRPTQRRTSLRPPPPCRQRKSRGRGRTLRSAGQILAGSIANRVRRAGGRCAVAGGPAPPGSEGGR